MNLKNKTVLITGSDGFIGSHLVERFLNEECKIKAFVYYNSFNSLGWLDSLSQEKLESIQYYFFLSHQGRRRHPFRHAHDGRGLNVFIGLTGLPGHNRSGLRPDGLLDNTDHKRGRAGLDFLLQISRRQMEKHARDRGGV